MMNVPYAKNPDLFVLNPLLRTCLGVCIVIAGLAVLYGAASIPFSHESFTIKYKFGLERHFLRTGQVVGVAAGMLLLFQFVLSGRLKLLDRIFAINRLYRCHRTTGLVVGVLVLLHTTMILLSEGAEILDPTIKNWPQYMGLLLLIMICGLVFASRWRHIVGLSYSTWRFFHTKITHLAVAVLGIHVLYACDTFRYPPPRTWLFISIGLYVLLFFRIKAGWIIASRPFKIADVSPTGKDANIVKLRAANGNRFAFIPGQFVFIRFKSDSISNETHPFTISSPPTSSPEIELAIRSSGDWTGRISHLKPGDDAYINGPYGLFGHVNVAETSRILMIAGGIGITPMLSILGALSEKGDSRPIRLLWSNRTRAHIVHPERITTLQNRLSGLRVVYVFTREPSDTGEMGRLDTPVLKRLLSGSDRREKIFICGPAAMMHSVKRSLLSLGFRRQAIVMERFYL